MQAIIKNKGILGVVALFIVAMFVYNLFFKSAAVTEVPGLSATTIGDDLIKIHQELQGVSLDQTLFSTPSYVLLTDFSTGISPQAIGRPNPFDEIGQD
jgi:hypothetical protein